MIVHLNGWPGVGKKTIGSLLANRLSARFIHNHLLHDVGITVSAVDAPERWIVYEQVRAAAYAALLKRPTVETFVMTNGLCKNAPREQVAWTHVVELASDRGVPLVPIVLEADLDEIARRLCSAERVGKKLTDPDILKSIVATDELQKPAVPETLVVDITHLSPSEVVSRIEDHIDRMRPHLRPATLQHLAFQ